jgi:hypothetical protein
MIFWVGPKYKGTWVSGVVDGGAMGKAVGGAMRGGRGVGGLEQTRTERK